MFLRLFLALLLLPAAVAVAACSGEDEAGTVFFLEVGDCFNDDDDAETEESDVEVVDCDEPHDNEVYYLYGLPDGDYPGAKPIIEDADLRCAGEFEPFVGRPLDDSELAFFFIYPTEKSWESGDQIVYCVIYEKDFSQVEGTLEGANR